MKSIFLVLCGLFLSFCTHAQSAEQRVNDGALNYAMGNYASARMAFTDALADPSITPSLKDKALYFKAKCFLQQTAALAQTEFLGAIDKNIEGLYESYNDLLQVRNGGVDAYYKSEADKELTLLRDRFDREAVQYIQLANASQDPAKRVSYANGAERFLKSLLEDTRSFKTLYNMGLVKSAQGDDVHAGEYFVHAKEAYYTDPAQKPNLLIGMVLFEEAKAIAQKSPAQGLEAIKSGQAKLEIEKQRWEAIKSQSLPSTWVMHENAYSSATAGFKSLEQQIINTLPEASSESVSILEKALQDKPNDYQLHVQMANVLLENKDTLGAIAYFEKAFKIDPSDVAPLQNVGTLYMRLSKSQTDSKVANSYLQRATPTYETLHKTNPQKRSYVQQILYIAQQTKSRELVDKYKATAVEMGLLAPDEELAFNDDPAQEPATTTTTVVTHQPASSMLPIPTARVETTQTVTETTTTTEEPAGDKKGKKQKAKKEKKEKTKKPKKPKKSKKGDEPTDELAPMPSTEQ
jgi:Tfp pilus assembly protein PilF